MKWRTEKPCADCPFSDSKTGQHLAASLQPGRMDEIQEALESDLHFMCHKTTHKTGNGTNLVCVGALEWQKERGLSSNYQRVCESLEWFAKQRREAMDGRCS